VDTKHDLSRLERDALEKLLSGDHPALPSLREQLQGCRVSDRRFTGVGFLTTLRVLPTAPRADLPVDHAEITDVVLESDAIPHGAGLVLFIRAGVLERLEGSTFEGLWPESVGSYRLRYVDLEHRDFDTFSGPRRQSYPPRSVDRD